MFKNKLKNKLENLKKHADKLNKDLMVLFLACKRRDVPWYLKIIPILVVGYALSPIDLIPDFIPILGYLDDLILLPLGIALAIKLFPKEILDECRIQVDETFQNKKPNNWIAGGIILLFWLILVAWILIKMQLF